jgi:hypothetical protein
VGFWLSKVSFVTGPGLRYSNSHSVATEHVTVQLITRFPEIETGRGLVDESLSLIVDYAPPAPARPSSLAEREF